MCDACISSIAANHAEHVVADCTNADEALRENLPQAKTPRLQELILDKELQRQGHDMRPLFLFNRTVCSVSEFLFPEAK
jgi:hypothetical protein